ncbi:MAG: hypothetical protein ACOH2H_15250 [Cypionkella sp.]
MAECEPVQAMNAGELFDRMQVITGRFLAKAWAAKVDLTAELTALSEEPAFKALEAENPDLANHVVMDRMAAMAKAASEL